MRRGRIILRRSVIALTVILAALAPDVARAQQSDPVPPPPAAQPPPPPPPVTMAPVPVAPSPTGTVPVYQTNASLGSVHTLPSVVPVMLGTGLAVLGGFTIGLTTALIVDNDLSGIEADGITAITFAYIFGAAFSAFGLYLGIGGLADAVHIESHQPGWAWTAAIASILGAIGAGGALTTALVDDDIGDDTIALGIAASSLYLATLLALIGLDKSGASTVGFAPVPFEGGAGLTIVGRL